MKTSRTFPIDLGWSVSLGWMKKNEILKEVAKYTLAFVNACGRPRPTTVCVQNTDFLLLLSSNIKNLFYSPVFFTKPPTPSLLSCCCLERSLSVVVSFQHAPYCKNTVMSYLFIYLLEIWKCCDIRSRFCRFLRVRSCTCSIAVSRSYSGHVLSVYVLCSYKPSPLSAPDCTLRVLPSISKPLFVWLYWQFSWEILSIFSL